MVRKAARRETRMIDDVKARLGRPSPGQGHHVHQLSPEWDALAIEFPRVVGCVHLFAGDTTGTWSSVPPLPEAIDTDEFPRYESRSVSGWRDQQNPQKMWPRTKIQPRTAARISKGRCPPVSEVMKGNPHKMPANVYTG